MNPYLKRWIGRQEHWLLFQHPSPSVTPDPRVPITTSGLLGHQAHTGYRHAWSLPVVLCLITRLVSPPKLLSPTCLLSCCLGCCLVGYVLRHGLLHRPACPGTLYYWDSDLRQGLRCLFYQIRPPGLQVLPLRSLSPYLLEGIASTLHPLP